MWSIKVSTNCSNFIIICIRSRFWQIWKVGFFFIDDFVTYHQTIWEGFCKRAWYQCLVHLSVQIWGIKPIWRRFQCDNEICHYDRSLSLVYWRSQNISYIMWDLNMITQQDKIYETELLSRTKVQPRLNTDWDGRSIRDLLTTKAEYSSMQSLQQDKRIFCLGGYWLFGHSDTAINSTLTPSCPPTLRTSLASRYVIAE